MANNRALCDDAPLVNVVTGQEPRVVTMIYPYYENPKFLRRQIEMWGRLQWRGIGEHLRLIVVDDGSPQCPASDVLAAHPFPPGRVRLFRIDVDVRWNWLAARNIGAYHAAGGWMMLTDMDHVAEETVLHTLIYGKHDPEFIYRFSRREHTGKALHPHPNSWFMTREMYWMVGGYDEALSGHYGTDGEYRSRCAGTAPIRIASDALTRYEYVEDSSTTHYKRKQPEDAAVKRLVAARSVNGWRPRVLSFPYHEVELP